MEWKEIKTQADADALVEVFGKFHDSCIRESHLWTNHYVSPDLSMSCPGHLDTKIRFLVHRQYTHPSAIELLFEEVIRFNLIPTPENCDSVIFDATLLVQDRKIYWAPEGNWNPENARRDDYSWVAARKLCWRTVNWLGKKLRYGPQDEEE